jgi:hypothetical protein
VFISTGYTYSKVQISFNSMFFNIIINSKRKKSIKASNQIRRVLIVFYSRDNETLHEEDEFIFVVICVGKGIIIFFK